MDEVGTSSLEAFNQRKVLPASPVKTPGSQTNLTASVESGFLFDTLSGASGGKGLAVAVAGGKDVGTGFRWRLRGERRNRRRSASERAMQRAFFSWRDREQH